jgi:hypothetical protein
MVTGRCLIVLAGYLVRFPLGGYAWQAAHYHLGLRTLGYDVWFYEDTGYYAPAFNPITDDFGATYDYGITAAASFSTGWDLASAGFSSTRNMASSMVREQDAWTG